MLGGGDGASGCWFGRSDEASVEDIRTRKVSGMDLNDIVGRRGSEPKGIDVAWW